MDDHRFYGVLIVFQPRLILSLLFIYANLETLLLLLQRISHIKDYDLDNGVNVMAQEISYINKNSMYLGTPLTLETRPKLPKSMCHLSLSH